jgi:hypothetical protein
MVHRLSYEVHNCSSNNKFTHLRQPNFHHCIRSGLYDQPVASFYTVEPNCRIYTGMLWMHVRNMWTSNYKGFPVYVLQYKLMTKVWINPEIPHTEQWNKFIPLLQLHLVFWKVPFLCAYWHSICPKTFGFSYKTLSILLSPSFIQYSVWRQVQSLFQNGSST